LKSSVDGSPVFYKKYGRLALKREACGEPMKAHLTSITGKGKDKTW
jgi:hypothetical protein